MPGPGASAKWRGRESRSGTLWGGSGRRHTGARGLGPLLTTRAWLARWNRLLGAHVGFWGGGRRSALRPYFMRQPELLGDLARLAYETIKELMAEAGGDPHARRGSRIHWTPGAETLFYEAKGAPDDDPPCLSSARRGPSLSSWPESSHRFHNLGSLHGSLFLESAPLSKKEKPPPAIARDSENLDSSPKKDSFSNASRTRRSSMDTIANTSFL